VADLIERIADQQNIGKGKVIDAAFNHLLAIKAE
jgi:hypothetical protein